MDCHFKQDTQFLELRLIQWTVTITAHRHRNYYWICVSWKICQMAANSNLELLQHLRKLMVLIICVSNLGPQFPCLVFCPHLHCEVNKIVVIIDHVINPCWITIQVIKHLSSRVWNLSIFNNIFYFQNLLAQFCWRVLKMNYIILKCCEHILNEAFIKIPLSSDLI